MEQAQQNIKMATEMVAELERLRVENQALKKELAQFKPPMSGRWSGKMEAMTKKPSMAPTTEEGWNRLNKFLESEGKPVGCWCGECNSVE